MTATDELRRLLDERGVEYETYDPPYPEFSTPTSDITTRWGNASYREWPNGTIRFSARGTTPEQAIEATLGPRTCRKLPSSGETRCFVSRHGYEMEFGYWKCSNCGVECFEGAKYCMNCGAKAVDCGTKGVGLWATRLTS